MTLTRAQTERVLIGRTKKFLEAADMDSGNAGTNQDLNDAVATALVDMGFTVASRASVADADIAGIAVGDENEFLDRAELRTLETILQNLDMVDLQLGQRSEKFDQLAQRIERVIARKTNTLRQTYGAGAGTISGSMLGAWDFAEKGTTE